MKRVVFVTGVGLVSPLGVGCAANWHGLFSPDRAISTRNLTDELRVRCGEPPHVPIEEYVLNRRTIKLMALEAHMGLAAASEAVQMAQLDSELRKHDRTALFVTSPLSSAPMTSQYELMCWIAEQRGNVELDASLYLDAMREGNPLTAVKNNPDMSTAHIAINLGLTCETNILGAGPMQAAACIVDAAEAVASGAVDVAIAGGAEDGTRPGALLLLSHLGFDLPRIPCDELAARTVLPGSGSAFLVLESEEHARSRGVDVIAELQGWSEVYREQASEDPFGLAIDRASRQARIAWEAIDWVHINAVSGEGLCPEAQALSARLGAHGTPPSLGCTRYQTGHLLAASAAFEVGAAALALKQRAFPPLGEHWKGAQPLPGYTIPQSEAARRGRALVCNAWPRATASAFVLGGAEAHDDRA